jgi:hypothetical protein
MSDFMDKNSEIMINKSGTIVSDDGIKLWWSRMIGMK